MASKTLVLFVEHAPVALAMLSVRNVEGGAEFAITVPVKEFFFW